MTDSLPNLPRVDVVVPCYNYGRFLQDCIESVLTQSGVRVRILIIDDCSTDDTPEVGRQLVAQDSRVSYRRHEINCGHIATYNVGLDWVQSELFVLLSADDMLVEGALQRVADVFEKNPKVVLVYGDAIKFYGEKPNLILSDLGASVDVRRGRDFVAQVCRECANPIASPAAAVVRTGTQKVVGGYSPSLPHSGDLEMWLRFAAKGDVAKVNVPLGLYRQHQTNMSTGYNAVPLTPLEQHLTMFNKFFDGVGKEVEDAGTLRKEAERTLAMRAFWMAAKEFEDGQLDHIEEFLGFSVRTWPDVVKTGHWRRLKIKRAIGSRIWRTLGMFARR